MNHPTDADLRRSEVLNSLQAGRAFAALAVILFHLSMYMALPKYGSNSAYSWFTKFADLGVDFFFVLSGFIILHAHAKDIGDRSRFPLYVRRRFARLFPVYWLYTGVFTLLVLAGLGGAPLPMDVNGWATSLSLVRFSDEAPPLPVAWTLFHELAFYALFSILLISPRVGAVLLVAWTLICAAMYTYPGVDNRSPLIVYTAAYNLNFILGMGAYWLYRRRTLPVLVFCLGLSLVCGSIYGAYHDFQHYRLVFAVGGAAVIGGIAMIERIRRLHVPPVLVLLGNASYTLYLTHDVAINVAMRAVGALKLHETLPSIVIYVAVLSSVLVAGVVLYLLIEEPLVNWCRRRFADNRAPAAAVAAN